MEITFGFITPDDAKLLTWSLLQTLSNNLSNVYIEIGSNQAKTSQGIARILEREKRNSIFIGIDLKERQRYRQYHYTPKGEWIKLVESLNNQYCKPEFVEGFSYYVVDQIPKEIVWLFVDGCHCQNCVERDIENYVWRVVKEGYVLFHDAGIEYDKFEHMMGGVEHYKQKAKFGVLTAIKNSSFISDNFKFISLTKPRLRPNGRYAGGIYCYQRK